MLCIYTVNFTHDLGVGLSIIPRAMVGWRAEHWSSGHSVNSMEQTVCYRLSSFGHLTSTADFYRVAIPQVAVLFGLFLLSFLLFFFSGPHATESNV